MNNQEEQKLNSQPNDVSVHFFVTGFGPFQGVASNPSSNLVNDLNDYIRSNPDFKLQVSAEILETSAIYVKKRMDELFEKIDDDRKNLDGKIRQHYVVLHLGVSYMAKKICLEQCAYNEATFRIPDERGYQPMQQCIVEDPSIKFGVCLETHLNITDIIGENKDTAILSKDPGRFVCNYTYCYSLDKANSMISNHDKETKPNVDVLFVHVPHFQQICKEDQFRFLLKLMDSLHQQIQQRYEKEV